MGKYNAIIDDGTKEYTIENKFGDVLAKVRISPSDIGMLRRLNEMEEVLPSILARVDTDQPEAKQLIAAEEEIKELVDYVLGGNVSDCFSKVSPLAPVGGTFFVEIVMNAIGGFVKEAIKVETKKSEEKMRKYTKAYEKSSIGRVAAPKTNAIVDGE